MAKKFISIDSNVKAWSAKANKTSQALSSASTMNSLRTFLTRRFRADFNRAFATQGASTKSGKWRPLSPAYARAKARRFPGKTILRATERLRQSYSGGGDSVVKSGRLARAFLFKIGSLVPYSGFHQDRKVIDPTDAQLAVISTGIGAILKTTFLRIRWYDTANASTTWINTGFDEVGDITGGGGF